MKARVFAVTSSSMVSMRLRLRNTLATGRPKDQADVVWLRERVGR